LLLKDKRIYFSLFWSIATQKRSA